MITNRLTLRASAGAFVLAASLGLSTAAVLPAQSAVVAAAPVVTTTTVTVQDATLAYGESTKLTVTVDAATNGPKPVGKIELRVDDKVYVADVDNSGRVDFDFPLVDAGMRRPDALLGSIDHRGPTPEGPLLLFSTGGEIDGVAPGGAQAIPVEEAAGAVLEILMSRVQPTMPEARDG